jgi:hypothetical protein
MGVMPSSVPSVTLPPNPEMLRMNTRDAQAVVRRPINLPMRCSAMASGSRR